MYFYDFVNSFLIKLFNFWCDKVKKIKFNLELFYDCLIDFKLE